MNWIRVAMARAWCRLSHAEYLWVIRGPNGGDYLAYCLKCYQKWEH